MSTVVVNLTPSDNSWTPPEGVTVLDEVAVWAGGGGGGDSGDAQGGGGAGAFCVTATNVTVDPAGVSVQVGARGTPGNASDGGAGGDSIWNVGVDPDTHPYIFVPGAPGGLGDGNGASALESGVISTTPSTTFYGSGGTNGTGNGGNSVGVAGGNAANSDGDAGNGTRNDGGIGDPNLGGDPTPGAGGAGVASYTPDSAGDGRIRITYTLPDPPPPPPPIQPSTFAPADGLALEI